MAVAEQQGQPVPTPALAGGRPSFQVIPVRGLPFSALIVVLLVVAIGENSKWALDFFHVVGGGLWTALDLFLGFVLGPILGRLSIPARIELTTRLLPKMAL